MFIFHLLQNCDSYEARLRTMGRSTSGEEEASRRRQLSPSDGDRYRYVYIYIYIYVSRLDISNFFLCSQKFYYQLSSEADMYSPQNHLDCCHRFSTNSLQQNILSPC